MLTKLPSPPPGKTGWPWTKESKPLPQTMRGGKPWPKISIITPSYNQGQFLEETIRSVLLQNYPNLEYIIMDGGSTDNSVQIIRKYEPWLTYWVSEKDNGQADAIYRGFERATGELSGWVNSDDLFLPGALAAFARSYSKQPSGELFVGGTFLVDEQGRIVRGQRGVPRFNVGRRTTFGKLLWYGFDFNQPATLWKRDVFFETGGFDRTLYFCFDYDMYLRMTKRKKAVPVGKMAAVYRLHGETKTSLNTDICLAENEMLYRRFGRHSLPAWRQKLNRTLYRWLAVWAWRLDIMQYLVGIRKVKELEFFRRDGRM